MQFFLELSYSKTNIKRSSDKLYLYKTPTTAMACRISLLVTLICLALLCSLSITIEADNNSIGSGQIHLDCGASKPTTGDEYGRTWNSDIDSEFAPSLEGSAIALDPMVTTIIPFSTARIFTSNYTYSFPVRPPGRMFLRLYFCHSTYGNYTPSNAYFRVTSGNLVILDNLCASQTSLPANVTLYHEYSINVTSGNLHLTFSPLTHHKGSYAFVNAIEIVPTPDLFTTTITTLANGQNPPLLFPIDPATAFETMYRFDVGGPGISPDDDIEFYRLWDEDGPYLNALSGAHSLKIISSNLTITYTPGVPNYTAPVDVYRTSRTMGADAQVNLMYNLTWILPIDAGFYYLLRFHFCENQYITKVNQRTFFIYINNQTAQEQMDVIALSGGIGRTMYIDYVIITIGTGQMDLWVALHPDLSTMPEYFDAILNGLEVFKLQNYGNNSLAALQSPLPPPPSPSDHLKPINDKPAGARKRNSKGAVPAAVAGTVGAFVLLLLTCYIIGRRKGIARNCGTRTDNRHLMTHQVEGNNLPSVMCHHFTFKQIQAATNNFDGTFLLGKGGFGNVYRGKVAGGVQVAIKRGNPLSQQGLREFRNEIRTLSMLRHRHLVSLIGYCEQNNEMILVYDYMAHGTLQEQLYSTKRPPLPWKQRLEICIGAAQGLHYLHTGVNQTVIHRDVKTANILLDDKFVAKVADFGLSKASLDVDDTHVSTAVKGTFGYLDPEYFRRKQFTRKSDVYAFGVVLLEVLCARPVINIQLPEEQVSLREWALSCQKNGVLSEVIDPHLQGQITPGCFRKFTETAVQCVAERSVDRPSMGDVLSNLQDALELQERTGVNISNGRAPLSLAMTKVDSAAGPTNSTMSITGQEAVFSNITHTEGR